MIRLPGWKPPVMVSRSSKPDGVPVTPALGGELLELVELGVEQVVDRAEVLAAVLVRDLEDRALGDVDELARRRLVGVRRGLDLVRRVQQPPQHRVLAHDARVLADVADGGHARPPAGRPPRGRRRVEQARLLEVLDERERVDRLADGVEVEHRLEDRARAPRGRSPPGWSRSSMISAGSAVSDSRTAPSTDCSASRFCGGASGPSGSAAPPLPWPSPWCGRGRSRADRV